MGQSQRILHISSAIDPQAGGTATALIGLAEAQARLGLRVSVLATWVSRDPATTVERLRSHGITVETVQARDPMSRHPHLAEIVSRHVAEADVVHIHALWESIQHHAARAAHKQGVPYVFSPHGMLMSWSMGRGRFAKSIYLRLVLRLDLARASAIHFTSALEAVATRPMGLSPPVIIEGNGVDLAEFDPLPAPGSFRLRHPMLTEGSPVAIFLGRLDYKKGLDLLIPAFARVQQQIPTARLVIAGPDHRGYGDTVRRLIEQHNLASSVLLPGMLHGRERIEALVDADLFVLPSYQENFAISAIEAMAAGLPALVSNQVGLHDEIQMAKAGGVIHLNVDAVTDALIHWLTDEPMRHRAGAAARTLAHTRFTWEAIATRWISHYQSLHH